MAVMRNKLLQVGLLFKNNTDRLSYKVIAKVTFKLNFKFRTSNFQTLFDCGVAEWICYVNRYVENHRNSFTGQILYSPIKCFRILYCLHNNNILYDCVPVVYNTIQTLWLGIRVNKFCAHCYEYISNKFLRCARKTFLF